MLSSHLEILYCLAVDCQKNHAFCLTNNPEIFEVKSNKEKIITIIAVIIIMVFNLIIVISIIVVIIMKCLHHIEISRNQ